LKLTDQTIYVSATPAELRFKTASSATKDTFRINDSASEKEELVPFVLPGETVARSPTDDLADRRSESAAASHSAYFSHE